MIQELSDWIERQYRDYRRQLAYYPCCKAVARDLGSQDEHSSNPVDLIQYMTMDDSDRIKALYTLVASEATFLEPPRDGCIWGVGYRSCHFEWTGEKLSQKVQDVRTDLNTDHGLDATKKLLTDINKPSIIKTPVDHTLTAITPQKVLDLNKNELACPPPTPDLFIFDASKFHGLRSTVSRPVPPKMKLTYRSMFTN